MIVIAVLATLGALGWTFVVLCANGMRASPGEFQGRASIIAGWLAALACWIAWLVG